MTYAFCAPQDLRPLRRSRLRRRVSREAVAGAVALGGSILFGAWLLQMQAGGGPDLAQVASEAARRATAKAPLAAEAIAAATRGVGFDVALLDPDYVMGGRPHSLAESAPLARNFPVAAAPAPAPVAEAAPAAPPSVVVASAEPDQALPLAQAALSPLVETEQPAPEPSPAVASVPLPLPRPPELRARPAEVAEAPPPMRPARRVLARAVAPAPDNRTFLEKLFNVQPQPQAAGPMLAYAAPETSMIGAPRLTESAPVTDRQTAVYDISAHTVYMPDGSRLEAHSGLGSRLDDPRFVHERMRGPTPPHAYDLTPRETLFHGVRALRLTPVGGGTVYGRDGLLAHTFMLGPNGDSNGCVSFRNYDAFLRAYSNGQVRRLVVVASR